MMQAKCDRPEWLINMRRLVSGHENPARAFWNQSKPDTRRHILFIAGLKERHVGYQWDDFSMDELHKIWGAIKTIREIKNNTDAFMPGDFIKKTTALSNNLSH